MTQLLLFVFFFVVRPVWADNTSLPNIHVADCFDGENVILAPGSICHDAGGMWRCRESPTGGTLATLCDDGTDYSRSVSLSDIETESGENIVTTGEFGLGELFPTGQRVIFDADSETNAFIVGVDTNADAVPDIGFKIYGNVTEGAVLKSIQTDVDSVTILNDGRSFMIKDATTPTPNNLFVVPEDGSAIVGINSFQTINVSTGTDPVADSSRDTINFVGTAPLVVNGDAGTKTVTFSLSGATVPISKSIVITSPTTGNTNQAQWEWPATATITRVECSTDTGTVTLNFDERAAATPNTAGTNTLSAALVCDNDSQSSCASGCTVNTIADTSIAALVPHNLQVTAVASNPTVVRIHVHATIPAVIP